jgi:hypothetical protein
MDMPVIGIIVHNGNELVVFKLDGLQHQENISLDHFVRRRFTFAI